MQVGNCATATKDCQLYKSIKKDGWMDFPSQSARTRMLYYVQDGVEYGITIQYHRKHPNNPSSQVEIEVVKEIIIFE